MKKIIMAALVLCVAVSAYSQEKNYIDQNYISVAGYDKTKVTPDMIYISITINESDTKGKTSVDQMERNMIRAFQGLGIDVAKQLTVNDISSNFKKYVLRKQDVMQSKNYVLPVGSAKMATDVFIALEKENISNATVASVDHSKLLDYKLESKVRAVKNAKEKAAALAGGVDRGIGNAMYIADNENNYYAPRANTIMVRAMPVDAAAGESMPEIRFQDIEIESNVTVYFELK